MPPATAPQPSQDDRRRFTESVLAELAEKGSAAPAVTLLVRRMNRIECLATLRDPFRICEIRLSATFPDDSTDQPFDTITEGTCLTPGHLLRGVPGYVESDREAVTDGSHLATRTAQGSDTGPV